MVFHKKILTAALLLALPAFVLANPDTMEVHCTVSSINELTLPDSIDLELVSPSAGSQPTPDIVSAEYSITLNDVGPGNLKKIIVAAEPSDVDEFIFANIQLDLDMEVPTGSGGSATQVRLTEAGSSWEPQDVITNMENTSASSNSMSVTASSANPPEVPLAGFYEMTLTFAIVDQS